MIVLAVAVLIVVSFGAGLLLGIPWGRDIERADADERCARAYRVRGAR